MFDVAHVILSDAIKLENHYPKVLSEILLLKALKCLV